jgi:hypothetical protein
MMEYLDPLTWDWLTLLIVGVLAGGVSYWVWYTYWGRP